MTQAADTKPTMSWDDESPAIQADDFQLSQEAAELPEACTLGEECTACQ